VADVREKYMPEFGLNSSYRNQDIASS